MTAAQWATELSRRALLSRGPGVTNEEARELAFLLEAAEEMAKALDELRVLTEGIVAQRGPLGDATVDRIMRRAATALAAWRGRK